MLIALGTFIYALGVNIFLAPNKISGGGTTAIATVLLHLFGIHLSVTNIVINIILYILGYKFLGKYILFLDILGVVLAAAIFRSFTVAFYSWLALYIGAKITDYIIAFGDSAKSISIFSDKTDEIYEYIKEKFDRSATAVYCKGMYSGEEKIMLYCVVSPKQLPVIVSEIKNIDEKAFVILSDVKEVLGEGFKTDIIEG